MAAVVIFRTWNGPRNADL